MGAPPATDLAASDAADPRARLLLASIHDVGPRFEREVDQLAERLDGHLGSARFAMLVVPDHWGAAPLLTAGGFQARLRGWADAGVEMFVHGWFHRDMAAHAGLAAFKARHMTASEGEFLGLAQEEAARRMDEGRKLVEDIIGRPAAGFIAPAWLYGPGARAALATSGFGPAQPDLALSFPPNRQDRRTLPDGTQFFGITGTVTNIGQQRRAVPTLLILLRDDKNRVVYSWEVTAPKRVLAPGESVPIIEAATDIPQTAKFAEIGWKPA